MGAPGFRHRPLHEPGERGACVRTEPCRIHELLVAGRDPLPAETDAHDKPERCAARISSKEMDELRLRRGVKGHSSIVEHFFVINGREGYYGDMKETRIIMGMPIEIEIVAPHPEAALEDAFASLVAVDERFSTYKDTSEISRINRGELALAGASAEMQQVFALAELTKLETDGYFDIRRSDGYIDPSGVVKG